MSRNQVVFETNNVIETEDNEIIIRDFSSSFKPEVTKSKPKQNNEPPKSFKPETTKNKKSKNISKSKNSNKPKNWTKPKHKKVSKRQKNQKKKK